MKFELDDTLIDHIIFCMEDRNGDFFIDSEKGCVIDLFGDFDLDEEDREEGRLIPLPDWSSDDGYRLMEKFTNNLKNPLLRQELTNALNRNKGVFRAFKDVLGQHPQAEKQWYDYKEKKMKSEVIAWYNALREEWGLEPIGEEPEDTEVLVLEDFVIREKNGADCELCFTAQTANGETAGCIFGRKDGNAMHIFKLEVESEFRGMGLGKTLLARFLGKTGDIPITIDVPADTGFFARSLLLEGFELASQKFKRN